jgi:sugar lactone lactonase YvrE
MLQQIRPASHLAAATLAALLLAGCGGGGGTTAAPAPSPMAKSITLGKLATSEVLAGGASVGLSATPDVASTVNWTLTSGPGSLSASSGASIGYLPPASGVANPVNVVITAKAGDASQSLQLTVYPDPGTAGVTLLAGDANTDYDRWNPWVITEKDGQGASAVFGRPTLMAADSAGNLYVVDYATLAVDTHMAGPSELVLRKVSAGGTVTTLARDTTEIATPNSIVVDQAGNIYVASRPLVNSRVGASNVGGDIRKVAPDGKVTVFAGSINSTAPARDGTGTAASFTGPTLAGIDGDGNLYVKDVDDSAMGKLALRKITPQAVVSTIAALPAGLGQAPDGSTYGVDSEQATVFRTAADGTKTILAGIPGKQGTVLGALPGGLLHPRAVVRTGPASLAVLSGSGIVKVVLPH